MTAAWALDPPRLGDGALDIEWNRVGYVAPLTAIRLGRKGVYDALDEF